MFNIYGDDIVLDGVKIGRLEGVWPTLRAQAESYLTGTSEDYVPMDKHEEACGKRYDEGYEEGKAYHQSEIDELMAQIDKLFTIEQALRALKEQGYKVSKPK